MLGVSQKGIRVDVCSLPVSFRIVEDGDGKVQMVIAGSGISGIANIRDHLPFMNKASLGELISVPLKVSVIEHELSISIELIDCGAAALTLKKFDNLAIGCRKDWRAGRRWDIDRVVRATFRARIGESIEQLLRLHTRNRNN